jgi:phage shock protein PspC (stress-responsive transcriptional regulator)
MGNRLYRSRDDRMIAGVAGGVAEYFDLDPSLVRIAWALLALVGGFGVLLYIVMAIVVPDEGVGAALLDARPVPAPHRPPPRQGLSKARPDRRMPLPIGEPSAPPIVTPGEPRGGPDATTAAGRRRSSLAGCSSSPGSGSSSGS